MRDKLMRGKFWEISASNWGTEEYDALQRVINSDRFTMGPETMAFESEFADYFGRAHAIMVNSGSSANLLAVAALTYKSSNPLSSGDEIIVPAVGWATTYHPLHQYGLSIRVVDCDPQTLNLDVNQLEDALTHNTRGLMSVSILGNPCDLERMRQFCDIHDLYFIEDNCESLDAEISGVKTGCFGDLATASFFFSHHISTMEGGMITTNDDELAQICRSLRAHGWTRDLPLSNLISEPNADDFFEAYRFVLPGYNLRPLELSAAVGREQLKKLPEMTKTRRNNMKVFQNCFSSDNRFRIQKEHGKSSSFCFTMIVEEDSGLDRKEVLKALDDADIGYRIITGGCVTRHDVAEKYQMSTIDNLPNANEVHDRGFFVGNYPSDLSEKIFKLRDVLNRL